MEFKDILLNNKVEVGKDVYLDFKVGTYLGLDEDGYHQLEYDYYGETKIKKTKYTPTVPILPLNIYVKHKKKGTFGEIVRYENFNDKMFYVVRDYSNVFKEDSTETLHDLIDNYKLLNENPFRDYEEIDELVSEIDKDLEVLLNKINELKSNRKDITKYCKHEWYKYEAEEVSPKSYEQECRCEYCGEEKINRFNRW